MVENRLYNIIALIGAILIYIFFIYTFVQFVKEQKSLTKDYGYNVEDAIVVELNSPDSKKPNPTKKVEKRLQPPVVEKKVITPKVEDKKVNEEEKPEKKIEEKVVNEDIKKKDKAKESRDIEQRSAKDLFSTIRTKNYEKILEERKKEDAARASRLAKQKAAQKEAKRKKKEALQAAKALLQEIQTSTKSSHKKRGERDKFWSKVSNRIMAKWNRTISTQDGLMATVKIRIDSNGQLTYKIKSLSNNSLFDTKLKIFLENLEYERFPKYHGGPYIEANFEFKDQAESF